ncbi:ribulose-phosphate 3-epimerase [Candidatus Micrarchaeota archaeon]|nr:ribulose-phosphate 3-epimerase [Candidatus Micrarchaeota archaeon]
MEPKIIPAILVKDREELLARISRVKNFVETIQLDIMDGAFVPNRTIGLDGLAGLPEANYEFHWMVQEPAEWIRHFPGNHMHIVHLETITSFRGLQELVEETGGRLGLALNPETPLEKLIPYIPKVEEALVMTVHPGFSGQAYMPEMEEKIRKLRASFPDLDIEVDGGVNKKTIGRAHSAGANLLAAASAIFAQDDAEQAIKELKECALSGCGE